MTKPVADGNGWELVDLDSWDVSPFGVSAKVLTKIRVIDFVRLVFGYQIFFRFVGFVGSVMDQNAKPGFVSGWSALGDLVIPVLAELEFRVDVDDYATIAI